MNNQAPFFSQFAPSDHCTSWSRRRTICLLIRPDGCGNSHNILQLALLQQLAYSLYSKRGCRASSETKLHATFDILHGLPACLPFELVLTSHCSHTKTQLLASCSRLANK